MYTRTTKLGCAIHVPEYNLRENMSGVQDGTRGREYSRSEAREATHDEGRSCLLRHITMVAVQIAIVRRRGP